MRSTQDPIHGLQRYIEEWGLATEAELKVRVSLLHTIVVVLIIIHRKSTRMRRPLLIRMLRRLRSHLSLISRTSGLIFITRELSRHSCAEGSGRRCTITRFIHRLFLMSDARSCGLFFALQ